MRKDMAKVIVERPRVGSRTETTDDPKGWKRRIHGRDCDLEDLPSKESMSLKYSRGWNDGKQLNENLNPLKRFLRKQVGRPWDKVYSEICENISPNSTVQQHILQHVWDFVEKDTYLGDDGRVWVKTKGYGGDNPIENEIGRDGIVLYIHPVDGLLKKVDGKYRYSKKGSRKPDPADQVRAEYPGDPSKQFHKINGIWFTVGVKPLPAKLEETVRMPDENHDLKPRKVCTNDGAKMDVLLRECLFALSNRDKYRDTFVQHYGRRVYAVSMKQSNGKELKAAGLSNDPRHTFLIRAEASFQVRGAFDRQALHDLLSRRGVRHFSVIGYPTRNGVYEVSMSQSAFDRVVLLMKQGNLREIASVTPMRRK